MAEKTKAITKKEKSRSLAWGGALPTNTNEAQAFSNACAKVYGVPSMGVEVQGNKPYLNKDGRLYLLNELRKGKQAVKSMRTTYIQFSTAPDMPAIAKCTITLMSGIEYEAIGEASKANVKLAAVQATLNMMAETRATNRAIWKVIAGDVWNRIAENLATANLTPEQKNAVLTAGSVSAEELGGEQTKSMFEDAKKKILVCCNASLLISYDEKIQSSKKYNAEQKAELKKIISNQVDSLDADQSQK